MRTAIRWRAGVRDLPAPLLDTAVAAAVTAAVCVAIAVASEPHARPPDAGAYLLGIAMGAATGFRRRYPRAVLIMVAALLLGYYATGYPGIQPVVPLSVPLYTAAAAGRLRWSVAVAAFYLAAAVVVVGWRLHNIPGLVVLVSEDAALLVVVILLGEVVRNRRVRLAELADRLPQIEARREQEAARRVAEERLHIAREVHDIVGHSVSVIGVHAGLAEEVLASDPERARESLRVVRVAARDAMTELKATVALLREGDPAESRSPQHSLADLADLAARVRRPGLDVELTVIGARRPVPGVVDVSAYRLVQESLTNVARHSGADRAVVSIGYQADALTVEVADNGRGPAEHGRPGHGLTGMAERVTALGGTFRTGRSPAGGFLVSARLPLRGER